MQVDQGSPYWFPTSVTCEVEEDALAVAQLGALSLEVVPGAAKRQLVRVSDRWRAALLRSTKSAPGLTEPHADRLAHALDRAADDSRSLRRSTLHEWAATGTLDEAYLLVMAWGLGTTGHLGRGASWARRALIGPYQQLAESRTAVADGVDIAGLWRIHFSSGPPAGLGSVAFGSKWLYALGYGRVRGHIEPLIYDENVYLALRDLAQVSGFAPARSRPYASWRRWCELAHETAAEAGDGISPADVEVALFEHARLRR